MTASSPDDQGLPAPPDDTNLAYARRAWRDVRALLIACSVAGIAVIAVVLLVGYKLAGAAGLTIGAIVAVGAIVLVARKLLTY